MLGKSITRNGLILGLFALATAGLLAVIYAATAERIAEQEKRAAEKALLQIVSRERHDNDMLTSVWPIPSSLFAKLALKSDADIFIATQNGIPVATIIPTTAVDGYSGDIKLLIGINVDSSISGIRVLSHKETPGLGDKVSLNKSNWLLSFNGKSLIQPIIDKWKVKKDGGDFDQFTGATITPRAVVRQVKETLTFFNTHKAEILSAYSQEKHND